jgi:hypothetical protein
MPYLISDPNREIARGESILGLGEKEDHVSLMEKKRGLRVGMLGDSWAWERGKSTWVMENGTSSHCTINGEEEKVGFLGVLWVGRG